MGDLSDLVASIRDKGVLEPILVRPLAPHAGETPGKLYRIIAGERRYRAAVAGRALRGAGHRDGRHARTRRSRSP